MQIVPVHASLLYIYPHGFPLRACQTSGGEGVGSCGRFFHTFAAAQGSCRSGQTGLTVNQVALAYGGSNPPLPTLRE